MAKRKRKVIIIALTILAVGALYSAVVLITGVGIPCPFRLITGLKCPGCGVSRMALSIIRFDFAAAFRYNPAIFCILPLMAAVTARYIYVYIRYGIVRDKAADIAVWIMVGVLVIFGVIRNLI